MGHKAKMNKPLASTIHAGATPFRAAFAAALAAAVAFAADVPWQFTGDDSRSAASTASAAAPVASFVSWTYGESIDESGAIAFSSAPPSFVLIMR